jgi:serine/threonine protein kinase
MFKSAFGKVFSAYDHKRKTKIALKIIKNEKFIKQAALREIEILQLLNSVDKDDKFNFVQMKSSFIFRSHICIAFELLNVSLLQYLRGIQTVGCSPTLVRRFTYSIIKSLCALSELKIIHSDLKVKSFITIFNFDFNVNVLMFFCHFLLHSFLA